MPPELSKEEKRYVRLGTLSIRMCWLAILALGLAPVLAILADTKAPWWKDSVLLPTIFPAKNHDFVIIFYFGSALLCLLVFMGVWFFASTRAKCPACGWAMLDNSKGVIRANAACPKLLGFSAWAYQVMRAGKGRRFMCISCGKDYDIS